MRRRSSSRPNIFSFTGVSLGQVAFLSFWCVVHGFKLITEATLRLRMRYVIGLTLTVDVRCTSVLRILKRGCSDVHNQPGISGMISEKFYSLNKFFQKEGFVRNPRTLPQDGCKL